MEQYFSQIDKTLIPSMPRYAYDGRIFVIQSDNEAQSALRALEKYRLLGFDTETRPTFRKGEHHKPALLQVASDDFCFLFRLNHISRIDAIVNLFANPDITKVGLSIKDDIHALHRYAPFEPAACVELQRMALDLGIDDQSLQKLYANVFGKRISKNAQLSNWEADVLSDAQKTYAATDAVCCIHLYRKFLEMAENRNYTIIPQSL